MKRPLMTLLGLFILGLLAGENLTEKGITELILTAAGAAAIIGRSISRPVKNRQIHGLLLLLLFFSGMLLGVGERTGREKNKEVLLSTEGEITLSGTVRVAAKDRLILETDLGNVLIRVDEKTAFSMPEAGGGEDEETGPSLPGVGDGVEVTGVVEPLSTSLNPGAFDEQEYYESEGVSAVQRADSIRLRPDMDNRFRKSLSGIRRTAVAQIEKILPEKEAGVLSAMLLGEKAGVDQELKELYRKNGIAHILAISGLHVSLLGGAVMAILLLLGLSRRAASVAGILLLFLYGALTGFSPATLRAVLMFCAVNLAGVFRRVSDMPTAAAGSLFLILLFRPYRAGSSGLMMSFLAVMAVVSSETIYADIFGRERFLKVPVRFRGTVKGLVRSVLLSFSVQLWLLPVMIRDYYSVSPWAVFLNLLVVPLLTLAVGSGALGLIISFISTDVGSVIVLPCRGVLWIYEKLCLGTEELPGNEVVTGHISDGEMLILLLSIAGVMWGLHTFLSRRKMRHRICGFVLALLVICLFSAGAAGYGMLRNGLLRQAVFFSVGQGDGCLLKMGDTAVLFDFGSTSRKTPGEDVLIPGLRYYGITRVDLAVISHTDQDHINGVQELLQEGEMNGIRVSALAFAKGTREDPGMQGLLEAAEKSGTEVLFLSAGDRLEKGELSIEILFPERGEEGSGNAFSLVALADAAGTRILFTGDIGAEEEKRLLPVLSELPPPDVLKVPHHGSAGSSSEEFLRALSGGRRIAVISCGRRNIYGHPASETLERLSEAGFTIYRTDLMGAVIVDLP